jgi:short-subunit dehydrogenase
MNPEPRTILITGAGTGIGRDAALALAARGHRVLATTLDDGQAEALQREAQSRNLVLRAFRMDITSPADRAQVLAHEVDVLINNAAIGESGSLAEVPMDRVRRSFEVNLFATLELTQLALRGMIARQRGTVLFVSSIAGRLPIPFLAPYGMTKFALSAAGAALRAEMDRLGCKVQVALIEPGAIHTGFNQAMTGAKFGWMAQGSYFQSMSHALAAEDRRGFKLLEARSTAGIVRCIVRAAEARRPRLRYVSPWIQGLGVRLARMFGV